MDFYSVSSVPFAAKIINKEYLPLNMLFHVLLCLCVAASNARWVDPPRNTFVGKATNDLSTAIFQGYIDDDKNIAFSPLGYSAILAILAEGAQGETRQQLTSALHLPEDGALTRECYKHIMKRLKNTNEYKYNQPELKNFFYIYKNYTINDDYKKILEDYYLTDMRSVERYNPDNIKIDDVEDDGQEVIKIEDKKEEAKPVETPKTEEIVDLKPPTEATEKLISFAVEDKPEKIDITNIGYKPAKNIKEKIKLVKSFSKKEESGEEEETMVAVEARNHARSLKVLPEKTDITSSISVNSVGKKTNKPSASNSLMILFNGMYFRGAWKKPFEFEKPGLFYKSSTEKRQVPMMKTRSTFRVGSFPKLDSEAIELPYDGDRYSLLLIVPRARDGLVRLIADLPTTPLEEIQQELREEMLDVCLPTFYVETTTKPVAALAKFGVSSIFGPEADLSGVSPVDGLFVQELVQHVAVRVDNADSSASQMSAGNAVESLKNVPVPETIKARRFSVEHPFIFYILDRIDNLVVVAGKVTDPQQPTPFDI